METVNLTLPHKFLPRGYQVPFFQAMDEGCKRAVLVWHRRAGKDKTALNYMIKRMYEQVGTYYYFFPNYNQAKKVIWDGIDKDGFRFLDHFPKQMLLGKPNDTELKIKLKNGSVFQLIGTENVETVMGTNPIGCIFSEYSLQNPQAWDYIRPILAQNEGWAAFIYTPRGMNHGWKILQEAKNEGEFDYEKNPNGWFLQVLGADDTDAISKEALEIEKRQMPEDLFNQEYYCKFIEGAGAFFRRVDDALWTGEMMPEVGHNYQIGVDLGKHKDFTVLTPFDLNTFKAGTPERFNKLDWGFQKAKIEAMCLRYNKARLVMDSTGLGDPIYDDLNRQGLPVESYKFTEDSREKLLRNLAILIEQGKIMIPNYDVLLDELRSFKYDLNERGKIKITVPAGQHDDAVFSLALATWNIPPSPFGVEEYRKRHGEFAKNEEPVSVRFNYD